MGLVPDGYRVILALWIVAASTWTSHSALGTHSKENRKGIKACSTSHSLEIRPKIPCV